ncbi:MAG: penicillin-binding transpeptidase domain-containing protein [Defluviitaleaceae bacterium]|nr:penicillin-binding transpeptidase domain-containing protein [Defluviitaleaceae bacterium]
MDNREPRAKTPKHERSRNRRAQLMGVFFTVCLLALFYRIYYWQSVHGDWLVRESVAQEARERALGHSVTVAERGMITDRNFEPLALSRPVYTVFVDVRLASVRRNPIDRETQQERDLIQETIAAIHEAFDMPLAEVEAIFARNAYGDLYNDTHFHVITTEAPGEVAVPLDSNLRLPDLHARRNTFRWYADPFFAPHIIGFRRGDAYHGLELWYNAELTGIPGRAYRAMDNHGNPVINTEPVQHGLTLVTTLDSDIQRLAQDYVDTTARNIPSRNVGILVMNPNTGEIAAMAQSRAFSLDDPGNPAYFTDSRMRANWDNIDPEEQVYRMMSTWSNFHISHSYEPGSIFKPFVIAAALDEGVITRNCRFYCAGHVHIADRTVYCWYTRGHGSLTLSQVLYRSCNVAMTEINHRLGRDAFYRYRGYFGFGELTGIDLPGEFDVASPAVMYQYHQLGPVQMATSAIGQGFNSTTIQSITAFSSLINGGNLMQPFVVSQVVDQYGAVISENLPTVVRRTVSEDTANWIRRDMQQTVSSPYGTGHRTHIPGYAIGAKTGSAQQGARGSANEGLTLTYIAYTPVENPEFIVLMIIDHVQDRTLSSGRTVAPIVRDFFEDLIQLRSMRPSDGPYMEAHWQPLLPTSELMPDLTGLSVTEVVRTLNNMNLDFHIAGGGTVVLNHTPTAGRPMPQTAIVVLNTDPETRVDNMVVVPNVEGLSVEQAEMIIGDAMLNAVLITGRRGGGGSGEYTPGTAHAVEREENDAALPSYTIYRQFPAPGTEVEPGLQVRLRRIER